MHKKISGYRGIVIFYGNPHAQTERLNHAANLHYMSVAAQSIGAAAAIQTPMEQIKEFREEVSYQNWHKVKIKVLTIIRFGGCLRQKGKGKAQASTMDRAKRRKSKIDSFRETARSFRKNTKETVAEVKDSAKVKVSRWSKKVRGESTRQYFSLLLYYEVFATVLTLELLPPFNRRQCGHSTFFHLFPNLMDVCWCDDDTYNPFSYQSFGQYRI